MSAYVQVECISIIHAETYLPGHQIIKRESMERSKADDYLFGGIVIVNLIGGLLAYLRASYGDLTPIIIWSVNCGLISLAGTIIEGR